MNEELNEVRLLGYGVDREEEMDGQVCIGAVVKNRKNSIAGAIWMVAPSNRMNEKKIKQTGEMIKQSADTDLHQPRLPFSSSGLVPSCPVVLFT